MVFWRNFDTFRGVNASKGELTKPPANAHAGAGVCRNLPAENLLARHRFQFISFCAVEYAQGPGMTRLHINDDAHLLHIVRGKATIFIEERQYTLRPGLAVAIAPFTRFYFQIPSAFEMLNVHYRLWLADGALLEEALALPEIFRPRRFSVSVEKLRAMQKLRQSAAQDPAQMAVYAHAVILNYLVNVPLQPKASGDGDARLAPVCRKLRDPAYAKFQAAELARAGGMSVSQMNRVFKKCFGLAPHQYWERQRFFAVCFHLRAAGGASIEEVAQQFGFDDAGYFFRWFKKMAGCTPAVFRRHIHQGAI